VDGEQGARAVAGGGEHKVGRVKDVEGAGDGLDRDGQAGAMPEASQPLVAEREFANGEWRMANGVQTVTLALPVGAGQPTGGGEEDVLVLALECQERGHQFAGVAADAGTLR